MQTYKGKMLPKASQCLLNASAIAKFKCVSGTRTRNTLKSPFVHTHTQKVQLAPLAGIPFIIASVWLCVSPPLALQRILLPFLNVLLIDILPIICTLRETKATPTHCRSTITRVWCKISQKYSRNRQALQCSIGLNLTILEKHIISMLLRYVSCVSFHFRSRTSNNLIHLDLVFTIKTIVLWACWVRRSYITKWVFSSISRC